MSTIRDTHFKGVARLLWEKLESFRNSGALREMTWDERLIAEQEIIAQCLYDFACYIADHANDYAKYGATPGAPNVPYIEDFTDWHALDDIMQALYGGDSTT